MNYAKFQEAPLPTGSMTIFHKGGAVRNAATWKAVSAISCAVLPLFLTAYTGLSANHSMPVSAQDMGLVVTFLVGAIGAVSTVVTSPKVGLAPTGKRFYER